MKIIPVYLPSGNLKPQLRYLATAFVGGVFVHTLGHTHSYALHKAFEELTKGSDVD